MNVEQNGNHSPSHSGSAAQTIKRSPLGIYAKTPAEAVELLKQWDLREQQRQIRITGDELTSRAKEIYEQRRAQIEPGNIGKLIVIDVESGEFEIDADYLVAEDRLLARFPDAQFSAMRIGCKTTWKFGRLMLEMDK